MKRGKVKRFVNGVKAGYSKPILCKKLGGYAGPIHEKNRQDRIAAREAKKLKN